VSDYKMLIGGELVEAESGKTYPVINPANGEQFATIALGDQKEVDKAAAAAKKAFPAWSQIPTPARADALRQIAAGLRARMEEIVKLEIQNHGTLAPMARGMMMGVPANLEKAAASSQFLWEESSSDIAGNRGSIAYVHREPVGICALITPWNVPLISAVMKLAPALVMGNTCILKPPSIDSATTLVLGEIIAKLDKIIPPGAVNIVTGPGNVTGNALAAHPDIARIDFTGSSETARAIMTAAAGTLKRLSLEAGGKNPFIVLADADLDISAMTAVMGQTSNSGQICISPGRYLVHERIHDEFVAKWAEIARGVTVGDPTDPAARMGPVVSETHRNSIESHIRSALGEGATMVLGKLSPLPKPLDKGYYVMPTLLTGVTPEMRVYREEIFGPVACITKFSDKDDVVAMANDNNLGLSASIWTGDSAKGIRLAHRVQAGTIYINDNMVMGTLPFGGVKGSGLGKEGGQRGMDEYCEMKAVYVNVGEAPRMARP
jgi:acyl-CoA reductase-like NAD-dependent aldehyde dehydrogenase